MGLFDQVGQTLTIMGRISSLSHCYGPRSFGGFLGPPMPGSFCQLDSYSCISPDHFESGSGFKMGVKLDSISYEFKSKCKKKIKITCFYCFKRLLI